MKKFAGIFAVVLVVVFSMATVFSCAAGGFELESSSPEDGYEKVQPANVMVKLNFSQDVSSDVSADMFKFQDSDGEDVTFEYIANTDDQKNVNLLVKGDLQDNTTYTVTVSGDVSSTDGTTLGDDQKIEFSTHSSSSGGTYMLLMAAMIAVMVIMTVRDNKKRQSEEDGSARSGEPAQTNPYKLAKEKKISVQEASAIIAEQREKAQKKAEKYSKKSEEEENSAAGTDKGRRVYRVKTKRTTKIHR